jgi:hypothetical protein
MLIRHSRSALPSLCQGGNASSALPYSLTKALRWGYKYGYGYLWYPSGMLHHGDRRIPVSLLFFCHNSCPSVPWSKYFIYSEAHSASTSFGLFSVRRALVPIALSISLNPHLGEGHVAPSRSFVPPECPGQQPHFACYILQGYQFIRRPLCGVLLPSGRGRGERGGDLSRKFTALIPIYGALPFDPRCVRVWRHFMVLHCYHNACASPSARNSPG